MKKIVEIEKSKLLAQDKPVVFNKNLEAPKLTKVKLEIEQLQQVEKELIIEKETAPKKPILVGDKVRIKNQAKPGEVLEIKGKKVSVIVGNFTFNTILKEVEHF